MISQIFKDFFAHELKSLYYASICFCLNITRCCSIEFLCLQLTNWLPCGEKPLSMIWILVRRQWNSTFAQVADLTTWCQRRSTDELKADNTYFSLAERSISLIFEIWPENKAMFWPNLLETNISFLWAAQTRKCY